MAKDAIGFSIVIDDKLIKTLRKADELIEGLSNTTERTRGKVIKAFRQMGDVGVESFIRKLREAQQAINDLGNKRLGANLFSGFSTGANVGVAEITKLINAVGKLSQASKTNITVNGIDTTSRQAKHAIDAINKLIATLNVLQQKGGQQFLGGVNNIGRQTLREMNNEARKMERTFDRLEQAIQRYGMSASDLANKLQQARDAQRRFNDIAKQQAIGDVQGLVGMKGQAKTLNELRSYAANLKSTMNNLDPKSKDWQQLNVILKQTNSNIKNIENSMKEVKTQSKSLIDTAGQLQRSLALLFSVSAIKGYVNKLISVRGEFELQQRALSAILQSKNQADKLWNQTVKLAIKSPFTVKELVGYTKQLAAYRIETDKLHDTTKRLADVSAGLGVDMQRIILAYGQVRAAAYLRGTELRQFTEAGIPLLEELAAHFSKLEGRAISVGDVFGMISKRLVSFEDVAAVFKKMTDEGGVFYQMQEKQAESLKGMMSNLKDRIDLMLNDIGSANDGVLKDMVTLAQSFVANWREVWEQLSDVIIAFGAFKLATFGAAMATKQFGAAILFTTPKLQSWAKQMKMTIVLNQELATSARFGQRVMIMFGNAARYVGIAFAGLARAFVAFLPFAIIAGVYELVMQLTAAGRAADELHDALARIDAGLEKELEESIGTYKVLATTIRDVTNSYAEREKALETLKRTFGEILPSQMLELEYILGLKNGYDEATTALKKYYETKSREQKFAKIDESFEDELSKDINELYAQFDDMKYKGKGGLKYNIMEEYGLDERHVKQVLRKVVEEVKKGNVEIANFQDEFIKRLNKMYNIDIDLSKFTYDTYDFYHQIGDIVETLTRYRDEIDAVVGMDYDTIAEEKHAKELEEANKKYEALTATLQKLSSAYSTYYNTVQALKNKEVVTDEDRERLKSYRQDIYDLYNELGVRGHLPNWNKFTQITASVYDIENEIERLSTIINNRFVGSLKNATTTGNTELLKLKNTINDITKSFDGTNLQQVTERLYRAIAEQYEMPLSAFDKLKVDGKTSVTDLRKTIENEIKSIEESIKAFDTALKNQPKIYNADYALAEVEKAQGFTKKQIEDMRVFVKMFTLALNALGGATKNTPKKSSNSIWEQRISLLKELRKEYVDLSKTFNETTSRQKVMNGYMEAANELFKDLGIDISQIPFDDLKAMSAFVSELMKQVKEGSKDEIKLGKLKGFFDVDIETKDTKDYQEQLIKQMQNLFDNYELGKELEKLHLPKELMKQLFDVDVLNLDELRDRITSMDISNFGEDALKEYDKLLDKIREMELKEQEERMKMYSKYLIKAQNERVKIKMDELKHIQDIEKTFAFNDDNLEGRFNLNPNAVNEFKTQLSTLNVSWDEAFKHLEIYRDLMLKVGFTDEQINQLKEYNDTLKQSATTAKIAVRKESKEKLDKQAWKDFTGSDYYIEIFADLDKVSTSVIKSMMERLKSLKGSLKLDPTEMKQVVDAMEKMDKEVLSREGFSFKKIVGGVKDYIKYLRERNGLEEAYNASQERIKNLEFNRDMQIDAVAKTKEEYDLAVKMHGATSDEAEALSVELVTKQAILDATLAQLVAEGEISAELAKRIKEGETTKVTLEERLKKNASDLNEGFSAFEGMMQSIQSVTGTFGDDVNDFMENVGKVIGGIATVENGLSQVLDGKVITGAFNMVSGAFQTIGGLFGFANNDKKKERQIQKEIEFVEKLEKAYEKLEQAIEKAYSVDTLEKSYDNAVKNINDQIKSYNEMIALEESKKDTDSDKIDEWKDKIEELRETQKQLLQDQVESLGGSYDIRSTTREFVDAWLDAFRETGSGLDGLKDNFKEFFQNILLEQAVMKGGATIMESLLTEINDSLADNFKIDSAEYDVIKQKGEITMEQLNEFLNGLLGEGGLFNEFMTDAGDNLSGLQKGIQGISESTAQVIEAYLNSVRFYVADSNSKLGELIKMQTSEEAPNPILSELRVQTELVRGISTLLNSLTAPHPTQAGRGLKVII